MAILIAGGSGLIGSEITAHLTSKGFTVKILSRKPTDTATNVYNWDITTGYIDPKAWLDVDTVINLAGSSIVGSRWTASRKEELINSRLAPTQLLCKYLSSESNTVSHFIQASAMGYYGDSGKTLLTEASSAGTDFMAHLCQDWENASANLPKTIQRSVIRIGLYLSTKGGVFKPMSLAAKFYSLSAFGNGKMWANYTHRDELNRWIEDLVSNQLPADTYNVVGAEPFTLNQLVRAIAKKNNTKILLPNIPSFLLKLVLGEAAAVLLNSYKVTSPKLANKYNYANLDEAIAAL
jgi:uncharacterized protein (TIGR01777 family)